MIMKGIYRSRLLVAILCFLLLFSVNVPNASSETKRHTQGERRPEAVTLGAIASAAAAGAVKAGVTYGGKCLYSQMFGGDVVFSCEELSSRLLIGAADGVVFLLLPLPDLVLDNIFFGHSVSKIEDFVVEKLEPVFETPCDYISDLGHLLTGGLHDFLDATRAELDNALNPIGQSLVAEMEDPGFNTNLPVWSYFGPSIETSGMTISHNISWNSYYKTWTMNVRGESYVEGEFTLSSVPSEAYLTLTHLTSAYEGAYNGGYSPIDVYINGTLFLNDYDVGEKHGDHGWNTDHWAVGPYLKTGTNTIRIELGDIPMAASKYWLKYMSVQEGVTPDGDNFEPNDTWPTSYNIGFITTPYNMPDLSVGPDDDWFRFTTAQAATSSDYVRITFSHSQGDLDMRLYKLINPALIQEVNDRPSTGASDEEKIMLDDLPGGTYLIKVYGYNGATNPNYNLTITPPGNTPHPGNHLSVNADHIVWEDDDNDRCPEVGENVRAIIPIRASSNVQDINATLSASPASSVNITDNSNYYGSISGGGSATGGDFNMNILQAGPVQFTLSVTYERSGFLYSQDLTFSTTFLTECPPLGFKLVEVSQEMNPDDDWNGNGIFNSGDEAWICFQIQNNGGSTAYDVNAALSPDGIPDGVHIVGGSIVWESFGDMESGQSAWPEDSARHWWIRADKNYQGTFSADILVYYDGIDESNPVVIQNAVQVTVHPQPWMHVDPNQDDFGVATTGNPVQVNTVVKNYGASGLVIDGIDIVAPGSINVDVEPALPWDPIPPGEGLSVTITIDFQDFEGQVDPPIELIMQSDAGYDVNFEWDRIKITGLVSNAPPILSIPGSTGCGAGEAPDASNSIVVWADCRNGNSDIYAYDIETGEEMQITTNSANQNNPRISDKLIVWEDYRNKLPDDNNSDLYGYDLELGQEFIVSNDPKGEKLVGVDKNKIAFSRLYHTIVISPVSNIFEDVYNLYLFGYDGAGGGSEQNLTGFTPGDLYSDKESISSSLADFGGGTLAWEEKTWYWDTQYGSGYWNRKNFRLRKMQVSAGGACGVDSSPVTVNMPWTAHISADDCRIVSQGESAYDSDQVVIWENGSITWLTPIPSNVRSENEYSAIGGNHIVYEKDVYIPGGGGPKFLVALDLKNGNESAVTMEYSNETWRLDGNLLVFRNPSGDIRYSYLRIGEAPVIEVESPSSDMIVSNDVTEFAFQGTANDEDGSVEEIEYRRTGDSWQTAEGTTNWNFTATDLQTGSNSYEIRVRDNDKNTVLTRIITIARNALPELVVTDPTEDIVVPISVGEITITGTAQDSDGFVNEIQYRIDGGLWLKATGTTDWTFGFDLHYGENIVEIRAKDKFGDYRPPVIRSITRGFYPGDVNADGDVTLADAILVLQIISGMDVSHASVMLMADVNGDGRIGLEEAIYILQKLAGLRTDSSIFTAPRITTIPNIDGVVDSTEWSAASSYNLDLINSAGDLEPTTWYFMNDASYLYLGVETSTTAHWDTIVGFAIDGNNDNYASGNSAGPHQDFTVGQASSIGWPGHTSYVVYEEGSVGNHVSPPSDLERATDGSSDISYEFKIPISTLNMASDTIAIRFWLLQGGLDLSLYQFFYPQYTTGPAWETVAQWPRLRLTSEEISTGAISVSSTPTGATVYLDGNNTGKTTPATLNGISVGDHEVYIALAGYGTPEPQTVTVVEGQTASVDFTLTESEYDFNAPRVTDAPTIDGVVDSTEWSAASSYNLDLINSAGDLEPTTWYFMNDASYLYLGVETSTTAHWDTIVGFAIDGNNDNYASGNSAGPHQDFTVGQASSIGWPGHTSYVVYEEGSVGNHVSPPSDLERATDGSSDISYEFKIPISTLNMASDTIAIRFWLLQGGLDLSLYQFFYPQYTTGPAWETVAQWPRLTIE